MMRVRIIAIAAAAMIASGCPSQTARPVGPSLPGPPDAGPAELIPTAPPPDGLRLPDHVRPTAYALEIEVDPDDDAFSGRVSIDLALTEPISSLWLNAVELSIVRARVVAGERSIDATVLEAPKDSGLLGLDLGDNIAAGAARLEIDFTGAKRQRVGLFRQQQEGRWYAYTDFEPTDARRAFPCFDDPRFKVPWSVTLIVRREHRAFANTPVESVEQLDELRKRVKFARTRPLPSYLVAFAAGPFDVVDGPTEPVPLRAIVPRGRGDEARWALDASPELLRLLADYFDAPVPYRKVDLISVPRMSGAMENPGLITIGSAILLLDTDTASLEQQRLLALVLAHEFAHLWFGDSVTMSWWDDLWLNEGFATWMADKAVAAWKPSWHWELEAVDSKQEAMLVDSEPDARAIRQPIAADDDIRDAFGAITYKKGGAVLAMFERWLGQDLFRAGVRAYVRDHADGTANADDLLEALSKAAGRDVATPFRSFLERPGLPTIDATLRCDGDRPRVELAQRRYRALGDPPDPSPGLWQIPVCVRHSAGTDCGLLDDRRDELALSATKCPRWIHPNAGEAGYYAYTLGEDNATALASEGAASLEATELTGVVANIRAGLRSGQLAVAEALPALRALASSEHRTVVEGVIGTIADLRVTVLGTPAESRYATLVRSLFGARARRLGLAARSRDSDDDRLLRPILVDFVGDDGEDRQLRARARRLARTFLSDRAAIDQDMREVVLGLAAIGGDRALFDDIVAALAKTRGADQRDALLFGIAAFAEPALTRRALDLALSGELRAREELELVRAILANPRTRDVGFSYFRDHYDEVARRMPVTALQYLPYLVAGFCTAEDAERVEALFDAHRDDHEQMAASIARVLDAIGRCDAFRAHHEAGAKALFEK